MSNTQQRLASRSFLPVSINANQVLNVPTGLIFKDGTPAIPWLVDIDGPCPFLQILQKNADGSFDVWNPTENVVNFDWIAHHVHSVEQEPITPVATVATPSTVPAPAQLCALPGYENLPNYLLGSYWLTVLETNQSARNATPSTILTDTDPDALNNAVAAASAGDVIEVRTNATYNPVTIPAATELIIRAGEGYTPSISGQEALKLTNGASKVVLSGFTFSGCSTPQTNYSGAAVTFATLNSIVDNIIFDRCTFAEVQNGSAVMLSYHWSQGGDNYQNPPQPGEESENISFIECTFDQACKEGTEGAALSLRPVRRPFVYKCSIDGKNYAVGNGCRGIQLQNCPEAMIHSNEIYNMIGNGEGIKFDTIGAPVALYPTGQVIKNQAHNCIEGIDIDDNSFITAIDNQCYDNTDEGISVDDSAVATLTNNLCWNNNDGILLENGAVTELQNNHCYANPNNNYNILNGYTLPTTNIDGLTTPADTDPADKRQGMIPADMVSTDQTEERANARWNGSQPASVQDALSKIVNNQYAPFEPAIGSANQGDILYRDATQWNRLIPGNAGEFLQTQGAGANPLWAAAGGGSAKDLAPSIVVASQDAPDSDTLQNADFLHQNGVTDAIQQAINSINPPAANQKGKIYIRRGYYLSTPTLGYYNIQSPIDIEGEGPDKTIIELGTPGGSFSWWYFVKNSSLRNLKLILPNQAMVRQGMISLQQEGCRIENVVIEVGETTSYIFGFFWISGNNTKIENVKFNPDKVEAVASVFYCNASTQLQNTDIEDCYAYTAGAARAAWIQGNVKNFNIKRCTFEQADATLTPNVQFNPSNYLQRDVKLIDCSIDGMVELLAGSQQYEFINFDISRNYIRGREYCIYTNTQVNSAFLMHSSVNQNKLNMELVDGAAIFLGQIRHTTLNNNIVRVSYADAQAVYGIRTTGFFSQVCNNTVLMEVTSNFQHEGIQVFDSWYMNVNGNNVYYTELDAIGGYGINIPFTLQGVQPQHITVNGNVIFVRGPLAKGISFSRASGNNWYFSITGNSIRVIGTTVAAQGDVAGIWIQDGCLKFSVTGNDIFTAEAAGVAGVGIFLQGGGAACTGVLSSNAIQSTGAGVNEIVPAAAPANVIYSANQINP